MAGRPPPGGRPESHACIQKFMHSEAAVSSRGWPASQAANVYRMGGVDSILESRGEGHGRGRPAVPSVVAAALPGFAAAVLVALAAAAGRPFLPDGVSEIAVAVALGLVVANLLPVRPLLAPGARFAVNRLLRLGIVLLGSRLALDDAVRQGAASLALVVATTTLVLVAGAILARRSAEPTLRLLIAAGTAICGNSAIVAVAPLVAADERDVAFAVATITGFGVLAVLVYPLVGQLLGLPGPAFGLWAGAAINDTSQVVAAGYAYGTAAGDSAVVTKLTRNLLLAPAMLAIGLLVAGRPAGRRSAEDGRDGDGPARVLEAVRRGVPLFVVGFAVVAGARSTGILDVSLAGRPAHELASTAASALILVALAGVGLQTDVRAIVAAGLRPLAFGFGLGIALAAASLGAIVGLGLGR